MVYSDVVCAGVLLLLRVLFAVVAPVASVVGVLFLLVFLFWLMLLICMLLLFVCFPTGCRVNIIPFPVLLSVLESLSYS